MNTNTIIRAQLFEYSNNPNIRGNTGMYDTYKVIYKLSKLEWQDERTDK